MKKNLKTLFIAIPAVFSFALSLHAKVLLGIDVLHRDNFALLQGKRIGLITNHTGVDSHGKSTIDLLWKAKGKGVNLVALFSPEHGIRGKAGHGQNISDEKDPKTGLPIFSLYGKTKRPTAEMLQGIDALVFDIQDIGTRFYTYTTTLAFALEEAAKKNIEFFVLDRPNPITGSIVEGEILSPNIKHFTAYLQIAVRHGMTVGEIANWYNKTARLNAKLTVVKMEGWNCTMWWDETGLGFRPPSPNIKNLRAAILYPGVGAFEATNVAVGRGTSHPFEKIGAPWIDGEMLAEKLNYFQLSGFEFKPTKFTPKDDLYKGQRCQGVEIVIKDRNEVRPVDLFVQAAMILREVYPKKFEMRWDEIARVTGSDEFKKMLEMNDSAETIIEYFHAKAEQFKESRKPYLLYDEESAGDVGK